MLEFATGGSATNLSFGSIFAQYEFVDVSPSCQQKVTRRASTDVENELRHEEIARLARSPRYVAHIRSCRNLI